MIKLIQWLSLSLVLALAAACGSSPPVNYYVLSAQEQAFPSGNSPSVGIGPIRIPEYLARDKLVTSREGNSLVISAADRWAEPLEDGIQRVLAINLAGQLDTQEILLFPWRQGHAPRYGVRVNLLGLDANDEKATLSADWIVYRPGSEDVLSRQLSQLQTPLPGDVNNAEGIAAAYSALLFQLSEVIATSIESDLSLAE